MKKRLVTNVAMMTMTAVLLSACGSSETAPESTDVVMTQEAADMITTQMQEEATPTAQSIAETSAEDFTYTGLQDGTIEIQKYNGTAEVVSIPAQIDGKDVSVIGEGCFGNKDKITAVVIPDTVKEIGKKAFINCSSLIDVKMSANIEIIEEFAFSGPQITTIELPDTLNELSRHAFAGCPLTEIVIPLSINEIEEAVFLGCDINALVIPGNVKKIEVGAFENCDFLKEVVLEDGVESLDEYAFEMCDILEKVTIPASVTEIASNTFINSPNVTIVAEPGSYAETFALENDIPCVNP